jgi:hypothetical protein
VGVDRPRQCRARVEALEELEELRTNKLAAGRLCDRADTADLAGTDDTVP